MFIDLSVPIEEHWRYPFKREEVSSFSNGALWQITGFYLKSHWFSHMDFPRHTGAEYPDSDSFPLEAYNGEASILDVWHEDGMKNRAITEEDIKKAIEGRDLKKILLIRSKWNLECRWESKEFWTEAPYLTEDDYNYILTLSPTAVGFDCPQDYTIRELINRPVGPEEQLSHAILLRKNILLLEYLTSFDKIPGNECELYCLPLKLANIDGSPVRCVAKV